MRSKGLVCVFFATVFNACSQDSRGVIQGPERLEHSH